MDYLGSEKGPEDIGKYGEGFKAAIVCLLRKHPTALLMAASGHQVLRIRVDPTPVESTGMHPLLYDFWTSEARIPGNHLIIRGVSRQIGAALAQGLTHFYYESNPLLGPQLARDGNAFIVYKATTSDGHVFYRNLRRGDIPGLPVVLVLNKVKHLDERAKREARDAGQRVPTGAERHGIQLLTTVVRGMAPSLMAMFDEHRTEYTIARTEIVLGELKQAWGHRSRAVFLAEAFFEGDFAAALAVFLHEHAHIFGHDGSRGFSDALTELLETVVRARTSLDSYAAEWDTIRSEVIAERRSGREQVEQSADNLLAAMTEPRLRTLLARLPLALLRSLLKEAEMKRCRVHRGT